MKDKVSFNRRDFLKVSFAAGAELLISIYLSGCGSRTTFEAEPTSVSTLRPPFEGPDPLKPSLFVRIGRDESVTITIHRSEMGQGVRTALAMILAEELDADWKTIHIEQADADRSFGDQLTGGSLSILTCYDIMRKAGAVARDMLVSAAAQIWAIDKGKCITENGTVINPDTQEKLSYGYLVPLAATLPVPHDFDVPVKRVEDFRVIGTRVGRVDEPDIITGKALYGMDVSLPGMLYAVVAHNPVVGGGIAAFDDTKARVVPGVRQVLQLDSGVAVVAENTWSALQGRNALNLTYDDGLNADYDSAAEEAELMGKASVEAGPDELVACYTVPFLSHAPMEPMNCVADARADACEVWVSTQDPRDFKMGASAAFKGDVTLHVPLLGGGFGRRLDIGPVDYVAEAVQLSKTVGAPVKLFWTRDEDIQHEFYHPLSITRVRAKLDDIGTLETTCYTASGTIPFGPWRSVTNVQEAFARECFLDEYAIATKQDPIELRRKILNDREQAVLDLAAQKAGWGTPLPEGRARGLAFHSTWNATPVAQVAEVSVDGNGHVRVHRVVCAVDCGVAINPSMIEAQMEGGIVFGLTAALKASINFKRGRAQETNFNSYPLLRMDETPLVEVHIVPSTNLPGGVGEMSNPVIMPAVANAIFATTGKRVRRVPIRAEDLLVG
jgi:isoquinoline 1-oxidoreductase beta subunit